MASTTTLVQLTPPLPSLPSPPVPPGASTAAAVQATATFSPSVVSLAQFNNATFMAISTITVIHDRHSSMLGLALCLPQAEFEASYIAAVVAFTGTDPVDTTVTVSYVGGSVV
eukprot:8847833-Pyramimonas_sp.AAC.1